MKPYAMRFARFNAIEDFMRQGWMPLIPNAPHHHQYYGIELVWLCACPVPGGFKVEEEESVSNRVPVSSPNESANGSDHRSQQRG